MNRVDSTDYAIVGGGLAGFNTAIAIRKHDSSSRILLVGDEPHLPYDRVPLSKDYLTGKRGRDRVFLRGKEFYDQQKIEVVTGRRATRLDTKGGTLELDDSSEIRFKRLMLATGVRARTLSLPGVGLEGIYTLRTLEDCERLRERMLGSRTAVVIGGGFIGCEVASIFVTAGIKTTMVEAATHPLNVAVDEVAGSWIADYFNSRGVNVMTDAQTTAFVGRDGAVEGVQLGSGETLPADMVAVGIGVTPNVELAESAGLRVEKGIVVDEHLATEEDGVFAAGDVARFYSPVFGRHLRVEHFDVAAKHGMIGGANMTGRKLSFMELPFFYSYAFDLKIRAYGDLSRKTVSVRRGRLSQDKGFFQLYFHEGQLVGFISVNCSFEEISILKEIILSKRTFPDPSRFADADADLDAISQSRPIEDPVLQGQTSSG
ncbi:MAG: NAD(P)/FAD-dependent oxidoreductase [Nitrososphaerales archaeon]|nr:NAD(P)/FAD-dependent oxidoreductase [Nitrososphaerales archaeon]